MKIMYIADDGTTFEDEIDCENYEFMLNHHNWHNIELYDENGIRLYNYLSQDVYEKTEVVIVPDKESLRELHEIARYTGFCSYHQIESLGTWEFKMDGFNGCYIKMD